MDSFLKTLPKNTQHANYSITCSINMGQAKYYYMIHLQFTRQIYEHCNTSIMNKSQLPFSIPWKPEEYIFTPSGIAYFPCLSNGDILKQNNYHTRYLTK